ncbi:MAG: hypothetical protein ABIY51_09110 [Ferruginibacter sp.]
MEIHHAHHPTHKKNWKEYLLEFFMLFFAVFLGFVSENVREHQVEKSREKEYIASLLSDLRYDTLQYGLTIGRLQKKIPYYDSLLLFLKKPSIYRNKLPFRIYTQTATEQFYSPSRQTIEQLKNSGNFRLIQNKKCLDSIFNYDSKISGGYKNQTEYVVSFNKRSQNSLEKVFDFSNLNNLLNDLNQNLYSRPDTLYNLKLISENQDLIQEVYNVHVSTKGTEILYVGVIRSAKLLATNLIKFLNKEYHLE